MTAEKKKEVLRVIFPISVISFIVVSGSIIKFHFIDLFYLGFIAYAFVRYVLEVKRRVD